MDRRTEGHRTEFHGGIGVDTRVLSDDSFVEKILVESEDISAQRIDIDGIASAVCRFYGAHDEKLRGRLFRSSRLLAKAAWIALETEGCTLTELAEVSGRDITTLSCAVRKLHARAGKDSGLADEYRISERARPILRFLEKRTQRGQVSFTDESRKRVRPVPSGFLTSHTLGHHLMLVQYHHFFVKNSICVLLYHMHF